jgi:lipopolysaccharide/colanic/teichoic acid biosynthesis glycosyltransferase
LRRFRLDLSPPGGIASFAEPGCYAIPRAEGNSRRQTGSILCRFLDVIGAAVLLIVLFPLILAVAVAIRLESPGPVLYRCRRVGFQGRKLVMLKFRKMRDGATGPPLTAADDERFTRIGRLLAVTKLDEIPQLWNVLSGGMSLVGPRPEDERFVRLHREDYEHILSVRPGITGVSQLAFARESEIIDPSDPLRDYTERILPEKVSLDRFYAQNRSLRMYLRIVAWTGVAVVLRRDLRVSCVTGRLDIRWSKLAAAAVPEAK